MKSIKFFGIGIAIMTCGILFASAEPTTTNHDCTTHTEYTIKTTKTCPTCDGSRYMTIRKKCTCSYSSNSGCERCDYKGYTETKVKCTRCDGTGKITVTIER